MAKAVVLAMCLVLAGIGNGPVMALSGASSSDAALPQLQSTAFPERNPNREGSVYDTVDVLTTDQERSIQTDITRASGLGVEMLVYTRMSEQSEAESQIFADRLNAEWGVESAEGANDGLVYLLTVNPLDPDTNSIVVSAGQAALPIRQFDDMALQELVDTEMVPEVVEGEYARSFQYGLRRVLNAIEYSPPEPAPPTSLQQTLHKAANVMGAVLVQFAVVGYFAISLVRDRRFTLAPGARSLTIYAVMLGVSSVVVGIVAIVGRNAFGSLAALGLLIVSACVLPLLIGTRQQREHRARQLRVTRRPAGRIKTIGSTHG